MPTEQYPGNSRSVVGKETPEEPKEPKKISKVVEGGVVRRKKPFATRFVETFVGGEDANSVFTYILQDVIVPATKDLVSDAVSTTVERMLFGEVRGGGRRPRSGGGGTFVDYRGMSSRPLRRDDPRGEPAPRRRSSQEIDQIIVGTRAEADGVIQEMYDTLERYDIVTVADLYQMLGVPQTSFTDTKFGWEGGGSLSGTRPVRVKGGYLIDLPRPEPIER